MAKWLSIVLLATAVSVASAQWATAPSYPSSGYPSAPGPYPESEYPVQGQYPAQNQYPDGQQAPPVPDQSDIQHGVARISIAQGDVNVQRGDNGQFTGALINAPLMARDHLQTSGGSRAEVQLDAATFVRLAPNTDIGFADLEYHRAQIQLGLGTVIFRVLSNAPTQVEIDTPSVGLRALQPGEYRISVYDNGTSQITVHSGLMDLAGPRGSEQIGSGRSIMLRGDASNPEMQDVSFPPFDQFDQFSQDRDQELAPAQSVQFVNADVQGASDLDRYGNWVPSGYGQVWQPQGVAPDWSPYSDGQWSYVDYYGWSWIDYAPWGWAPYHYGRWFWNSGYGWCWWPGARSYSAYWRPALVGFVGFGAGGVGWVALAPYERYHPWWGHYAVGFGYAGYGLAGYHNAAFRGGVLFSTYDRFGGIRQRYAVANRTQILQARAISGRLPVTVNRASYNFSNRSVSPNSRFANVQSHTFYHQGFQGRAFGTVSNGGARSFSSNNSGWQRFGATPSVPRQSFQGGTESSGWHSFGQTPTRSNVYQAPRSFSQPAQRYSQPSYQTPRNYQQYSAPRTYQQPRSYAEPKSYTQPHSSSAPRQNYSRPSPQRSAPQPHNSAPSHSGGGGGGSHSSGGGGGHHGR